MSYKQFGIIQVLQRSPILQASNWSGTFFCCFLQQTASRKTQLLPGSDTGFLYLASSTHSKRAIWYLLSMILHTVFLFTCFTRSKNVSMDEGQRQLVLSASGSLQQPPITNTCTYRHMMGHVWTSLIQRMNVEWSEIDSIMPLLNDRTFALVLN